MRKIEVVAVGTGYRRQNGYLYLKGKDGTHSKFEIDSKTGEWVVDREKEAYLPNEEVTPIVIVNKRHTSLTISSMTMVPNQRPALTALTLLTHIEQTWVEHDSLMRSLQKQWTVSHLDFTMLLMELRNSKAILRERKPVGSKMCYHYKKSA